MVAVPAVVPAVITPSASILAMDEFDEVHVPPVTVEVNVVEVIPPLKQMAWSPLKLPALRGGAVTVTVSVPIELEQPPLPITE